MAAVKRVTRFTAVLRRIGLGGDGCGLQGRKGMRLEVDGQHRYLSMLDY